MRKDFENIPEPCPSDKYDINEDAADKWYDESSDSPDDEREDCHETEPTENELDEHAEFLLRGTSRYGRDIRLNQRFLS